MSAQTSTGSGEIVMVIRMYSRMRAGDARIGGRFPPGRRGNVRRVRLLVLAAEYVGAHLVRRALPDADLDGAEVLVVSPAVSQSAVVLRMSDSDEAIAESESRTQRLAVAL